MPLGTGNFSLNTERRELTLSNAFWTVGIAELGEPWQLFQSRSNFWACKQLGFFLSMYIENTLKDLVLTKHVIIRHFIQQL